MAISPLFPSCCRFTPSCSEYAKIAIERFGLKKAENSLLNELANVGRIQTMGMTQCLKDFKE